MVGAPWTVWLLVGGAVVAAVATYPFTAVGIAYRRRDNGLAYLVLVIGLGLWNGMFAAQYVAAEPMVNVFFYSLSMVGAQLAGLGWFLFASTASSTPEIPRKRVVYGLVGLLVGLGVVLTVTTPVHALYWSLPAGGPTTFAVVVPEPGYWLHALLLAALFGGGTAVFAVAWRRGSPADYTRTYALVGAATTVAVLGSAVLAPGGLSVAPHLAVGLPAVGWLQVRDRPVFARVGIARWRGRSGQ